MSICPLKGDQDSFGSSNTESADQYIGSSTEGSMDIFEATNLSPLLSGLSHTIQPTLQDISQNPHVPHTSTVDAISTLITFPNQFIQSKPTFRRQRVRSNPQSSFRPDDTSLSLDRNRQCILEYIFDSSFYKDDVIEPKLGTPEANDILFYMNLLQNVSFPSSCIKTGRSFYSLLTDPVSYKCLLCGSIKKSAQRAVDCVRAHIGHRPFRCTGWRSGCGICVRMKSESLYAYFLPY
jgi:hypothetical protein